MQDFVAEMPEDMGTIDPKLEPIFTMLEQLNATVRFLRKSMPIWDMKLWLPSNMQNLSLMVKRLLAH